MKQFLFAVIWFYQQAISPLLSPRCRFYPTCSNYAKTALRYYPLLQALRLIIRRLLRCQPFGSSGVDFVPINLSRCQFFVVHIKTNGVFLDPFEAKKQRL